MAAICPDGDELMDAAAHVNDCYDEFMSIRLLFVVK